MDKSIYKAERNALIYEVYKEIVSTSKHISLTSIYRKIINRTYPCFYISPKRATVLIYYASHKTDNKHANALYEVYRKVANGRSVYSSIYDVISHPSPSLFISMRTLAAIIQRMRKKSKQQRIVALTGI